VALTADPGLGARGVGGRRRGVVAPATPTGGTTITCMCGSTTNRGRWRAVRGCSRGTSGAAPCPQTTDRRTWAAGCGGPGEGRCCYGFYPPGRVL